MTDDRSPGDPTPDPGKPPATTLGAWPHPADPILGKKRRPVKPVRGTRSASVPTPGTPAASAPIATGPAVSAVTPTNELLRTLDGAQSALTVPDVAGVTQSLLTQPELARAGIPATYDDGIEWLRSGLRRHPSAVAVGLIFGWTGIWLAFWGAAAGAFLGFLVGLAIGNHTIPIFTSFGAGQAASAVTVAGGVVLGFIGGFIAVVVFLFIHPAALVGSLISGAIIATALLLFAAAFERLGLRVRGYRRLSRDEVRQVASLVKAAADAMDLPALPRFAIADQVMPNAWTHMRTIVLTTGLLQSLEATELQSVLVHELNHWRSGDSVGLRCVWAASWPVVLVYNLAVMASGRYPTREGTVRITVSSGVRWIIAWSVGWPSWVMVRLILTPLTAASQRRYEYQADAAAKDVGLASQLASALNKMGMFEAGRTGWEAAMMATHPPTRLRIEALQPPRPDDWEYQEEELRGPSWAEVRRLFRGVARSAWR